MRRYALLTAALVVSLLLVYVGVEALDVPVLTDPSSLLDTTGLAAAAAGTVLLVVDVLLPVPSSLVMIAHGALFGVVLGALLSLIGRVGFALLGFAVGRRGAGVARRIMRDEEGVRADRLVRRWGALAIVLTRPAPLLAEATTIVAGTSTMTWRAVAVAALIGSVPEALLYALTGALAATFENGALVFLFTLLVSGLVWIVLRRGTRDPAVRQTATS